MKTFIGDRSHNFLLCLLFIFYYGCAANATLPKASDDADIEILLYSNIERTDYYVDGKFVFHGKLGKILISDKPHTIVARPEGYIEKEYYVQPPFSGSNSYKFYFMIGEKIEKKTPSEETPASIDNRTVFTPYADVDKDIPRSRAQNNNGIAVVIGNRDYEKAKSVVYAINDALAVKEYLIKVFGYKEGNIYYVPNARKADFELLFGNEQNYKGKLFNAIKSGKSDVFIYYSGHGAPGLKDKKGYFVPVEADPQYVELSGYPVNVFYQNLSMYPARSITVVLDTCFSGASVFENISPLVLNVDKPTINMKNGVVLSSSSGSQVSSWYSDKKHGLFTYYFLKAIHDKVDSPDKDNTLTFEEVYKSVADKTEGVPYYARKINGVEQDPTIEGNYQDKIFLNY